MKLNDSITKSVAASVSDVLEGKKKYKKEDDFKPHMMYDPKTGKGYKAEKPEDHERMKKLGYTHEKPEKVDEVDEPNKPSGKLGQDSGERDFKGKHKAKKSGEKEDGTVVKENWMDDEPYSKKAVSDLVKAAKKDAGKLKSEDDFNDWMADKGYPIMMKHHKPGPFHKGKKTDFVKDSDSDLFDRYRKDIIKALRLKLENVVKEMTITLDEAKLKAGRGKANVDIDHTGEGVDAAAKKYKLKFKKHRNGFDVSGEKKNILAYLQSKEYNMDSDDIQELFPELMEGNMAYENALVKKAVKIASSMGGAMTPAVKKIEKLKKGLSDHPDVKAALKAANEEKEDDKEEEKPVKVESDKEKYQRFFQAALKKFGVKSPAELDGAKKKEFFDYVDKNYEADNEAD